ncbi:hypothetical protein U9M48_034821 [Paspalum notatum var. saurae]|uniref:Bifunctional inhibitor/plant lipid transfer protein/seed storage helical domain-containing protein n=1 Tax=Paspalum notatum var. saurae TaxID=547442 RepID=A0AAQ3X7R1_PASNO
MATPRRLLRERAEAAVASLVAVRSHEIPPLMNAAATFFFILSAYFVVLPLRDEGAISLGLDTLPGLFAGSLLLTVVAAPIASLAFSLPSIPKPRALVMIHRFFSISLLAFFVLWYTSTPGQSGSVSQSSEGGSNKPAGWRNQSWFYIVVRISLFLWVALLNLITISSTWARVIDVLDSESGSRLFGFIGAGATLGQLFGSLFAASMAWLGPFLLLFSSLLMELAALSSKGICIDGNHASVELSQTGAGQVANAVADDETSSLITSPRSTIQSQKSKPGLFIMFEGFWLILRSSYLIYISLFLWLSAVVSSVFYFQKVMIVATTISSPTARRRTFALINSFIAVFILAGQLTLTGRILTVAGVTVAICASPFVAASNLVALAVCPTWVVVAITETIRKVTTYVLTRPGRELLFTVVSQDEKYKAKVCIDVIVQRLGDATAAGFYRLLFNSLEKKTSMVTLFALPASDRVARKAASMAKKHAAAVVIAVAAVLMTVQPSAASNPPPDADALRFPGRPGSRPRNPVFPGYPRGRTSSPPTSGSVVPGVPAPTPGGVPSSAPGSPPPCSRPAVPQLPGFPGLPGSVGGSTPSSPTECVTPLAGLMTCGAFLTGSEPDTPTPQSECCNGLGAFLNSSSAAAPGDDRTLRCLCPVILGDVNKMLPKPVDPVRMMYLPIACGVVLPPQVLYICFSESSSSSVPPFHSSWIY